MTRREYLGGCRQLLRTIESGGQHVVSFMVGSNDGNQNSKSVRIGEPEVERALKITL